MKALSIGRSSLCDIVVPDPTVSRRHAELTELGRGDFLFEDLGSTSGSFLRTEDGWRPLSRATLSGRDWIRLGDVEGRLSDLIGGRCAPERPLVERDPETGQIVVRPR